MKVPVVDVKGNKVKDITLSDAVFKIKPNKELLGQYLRVYLANQRQGTAHTKTRSEVSGGGKKPWRQKGTGRARHGSIRSPIWVGGGVAHGPRAKSWRMVISKKQRRLAMKSAMSQAFNEGKVSVVDDIKMTSHKTKEVKGALANILSPKNTLIVWLDEDTNLMRGCRNLKSVELKSATNLNAYEVLRYNKVVMSEQAAKYLEGKYKDEAK
jgi:large subunit ribosomal protein L4